MDSLVSATKMEEARGIARLAQAYTLANCAKIVEAVKDGKEHYKHQLSHNLNISTTATSLALTILIERLGIVQMVGYRTLTTKLKSGRIHQESVIVYYMKPEYIELCEKYHDIISMPQLSPTRLRKERRDPQTVN